MRFHKHSPTGPMSVRLKVLAGTQLVENCWKVLKHHILPHEAPADMALIEEYALAYVHRFHATEDPFMDLGRAVAGYLAFYGGDPLSNDPAYKKDKAKVEAAEAPEMLELLSAQAPAASEVPGLSLTRFGAASASGSAAAASPAPPRPASPAPDSDYEERAEQARRKAEAAERESAELFGEAV